MAAKLPKDVHAKIKNLVFKKADEFGYMESNRVENSQFLDQLVEDPEVGQVINQYMPKERIRTYIKDGVLNAYTKSVTDKALSASAPEKIIQEAYGVTASVIQECSKGRPNGVCVLRAESGEIYVVSKGTVLKWETALRKALEIIANEPNLNVNETAPKICLNLSLVGQSLTEADKTHIISALGAVGVKAIFSNLTGT